MISFSFRNSIRCFLFFEFIFCREDKKFLKFKRWIFLSVVLIRLYFYFFISLSLLIFWIWVFRIWSFFIRGFWIRFKFRNVRVIVFSGWRRCYKVLLLCWIFYKKFTKYFLSFCILVAWFFVFLLSIRVLVLVWFWVILE